MKRSLQSPDKADIRDLFSNAAKRKVATVCKRNIFIYLHYNYKLL
jgi:hypothetical protein